MEVNLLMVTHVFTSSRSMCCFFLSFNIHRKKEGERGDAQEQIGDMIVKECSSISESTGEDSVKAGKGKQS